MLNNSNEKTNGLIYVHNKKLKTNIRNMDLLLQFYIFDVVDVFIHFFIFAATFFLISYFCIASWVGNFIIYCNILNTYLCIPGSNVELYITYGLQITLPIKWK